MDDNLDKPITLTKLQLYDIIYEQYHNGYSDAKSGILPDPWELKDIDFLLKPKSENYN